MNRLGAMKAVGNKGILMFACMLMLLAGTAAYAGTVIIDTYGLNGQIDGWGFPIYQPNSGWAWAVGFQMPTGQSYTLNSVTFRLAFVQASQNDVPVLSLFADNGSNYPGTRLGGFTLTGPAFPDQSVQIPAWPLDYTFVPAASTLLSAGSTYWLGFDDKGPVGQEFDLIGSSGTGITGLASYLGAATNDDPSAPLITTGAPYFSVDATPSSTVPEPSLVLLLSIGLVGVMVCCWRLGRG